RLKTTSVVLMLIGIVTIIIGAVALLGTSNPDATLAHADKTRFWIVLLHNSVFFLLIAVASVFIQAAASLAQGGWIVAYKRVPEAIGANVWVFGLISSIILILIAFTFNIDGHNPIYHWMTPHGDKLIEEKSWFLNPGMFVGFTIITISLWSFFGKKF